VSTRPRLVTTQAELKEASSELLGAAAGRHRSGRASQALVPTMGALHSGHAALVDAARQANDVVVASIFVNPLQFGEAADLQRYPRTLEADLEVLAAAGADIAFAPAVEEVYPDGEPLVRISAGRLGEKLEGASRPGHFDGALTVVAKLLHYGLPALPADYRAYFGQKDAQQLALVRRMVVDLDFPVEIVGVPIVRDGDGLALSSRNRFLSPDERHTALALSQALFAGEAAGTDPGQAEGKRAAAVRSAARAVLDRAAAERTPLAPDYLALVDPVDFTEIPDDRDTGEALLVVAARVGATRLIDNIPLTLGAIA
jgi:pantoate--beta-alanine ligase